MKKQQHQISLVGQSPELKQVLNLIDRVADSDATILISGESGTGKELIAKRIHLLSSRKHQPFVTINCGAIPHELIESELFGHVKGAFTGAISNRVGRFELADGGTLFLDEIGELAPAMQVKLLRALQEQVFEPVGSTKSIEVDVRVIAATNRNLEEMVMAGKFREDLYYRLNVIPMHIPSLRDRKEDIPLLLNHYLDLFNQRKNSRVTGFSSEAIQQLMSYSWPGNIRELENLVERVSLLKGEGEISITDLPPKYQANQPGLMSALGALSPQSSSYRSTHSPTGFITQLPEGGIDFNSAVDEFENQLLIQALEKTGWNRNQAAILLRLNRTTLVEKLKKKGLRPTNNLDLGN
jgi:transcriptional regulator with GAF, ATPase, and Fis domain